MNNEREYLKNKNNLERVSICFNKTINLIQQLVVVYTQLDKSNQLDQLQNKTKINNMTERVFDEVVATVRINNLLELGAISPQILMFPIGYDKILKLDFSKCDVRTIHIYELKNQKTYSLSQSAFKVTLTATPFQRIYNIQDMEDNWREYNLKKSK